MSVCLGLDTSNYTTSVALVSGGRVEKNLRTVLAVGQGERGLRQSDAVFAHTVNLPAMMEQLGACRPDAVGVSLFPRDAEGSYMPCFLAGKSAAASIASVLGVPLYGFSHQRGHLMAALYSCGRTDLYGEDFLAFHVSGGTTEVLLVRGEEITLLGGSEDISCGKLIDRVGVMLGLSFPCGRELERLAEKGKSPAAMRPSLKDMKCNLSGGENRAADLIKRGETPENVAAFTLDLVRNTILGLSERARKAYPALPIVYAGGVMSNRLIRPALEAAGQCFFAAPEFSCDNAAGIALLCERKLNHG